MFKRLTRQEKSQLACKAFAKYADDDSMIAVFENEKDRDSWVKDKDAFFERIALSFVELFHAADCKLDVVMFEDDVLEENMMWLRVPHKMYFDGILM